MNNEEPCICESGKSFSKCCLPLLSGRKKAKTPTQLMRSRYSAFALGGYGEYLLNTWVPEKRGEMSRVDLSQRAIDWRGLEIVSHSQQGDRGCVEFRASLVDSEGNGEVHHERSRFIRLQGEWLYKDGDIL